MDRLYDIVSAEGELIGERLIGREPLYTGRNSRVVERVRLHGPGVPDTVIFKPLTYEASLGKEVWASRHVLPLLPEVRSPKLLQAADHTDPRTFWMLYEDVGPAVHGFDAGVLVRTAADIPYWHRLPLSSVPEAFAGHTPLLADVWARLRAERDRLAAVLAALGLDAYAAAYLLDAYLCSDPAGFAGETVISHGDLNPLNLVLREGEIIILDWEYIHRNSVYWDLYNLLDITSTKYRRPPAGQETRLAALGAYAAGRERAGMPVGPSFVEGYHAYALAYSAWILLLIEGDLTSGRFEREALQAQREETFIIITELLDVLRAHRRYTEAAS